MTRRRRTPPPRPTAVARRESAPLAPSVDRDLEAASELAQGSRSSATRRAYRTDVAAWTAYAQEHGIEVFPVSPPALAAYIGRLAQDGMAISTIRRRCSALASWHKGRREFSPTDDPTVKEVLGGLARERGSAPDKKRPLTLALVRQIVLLDHCGVRDRAILLVGIFTGMRRSEFEGLVWADVLEEDDGVVLRISRSKTDQEGHGAYVGLLPLGDKRLCPVTALETLRRQKSRRPARQSVFGCTGKTINRVVKRWVQEVGIDPGPYGAHSFRSGFATEARRAGASLDEIMGQTRHKNETVARGYIETVDRTKNRALLAMRTRMEETT